jgi:hypothetical protein
MRELKKLWARIIAPTIIGGSHHAPGELVAVDSGVYRQLLASDLAVPAASPLAAAITATAITPFEETAQ